MKYKLSFYRKVAAFALLLLLSLTSHIFSQRQCIDLTKGNPVVPILHTMAPVPQVLTNIDNVITEPGAYVLVENTRGSITVKESNVIIDLNGFSLINTKDEVGDIIKIDPGVTDVIIKNGAIIGNCTKNGIALRPRKEEGTPSVVTLETIKRVTLENLRISYVNIGIYFAGTYEDSTLAAVECCDVTDCRISNCTYGVVLDYADKNIFKDVEICCFKFDGFVLRRSRYNKFEQCKTIKGGHSLTTTSMTPVPNTGFRSIVGKDNLFYECFAEGICKGGNTGFCTKTTGFFFGFGEDLEAEAILPETESKIINCCVDSITTCSFGNAVGVYLESKLVEGEHTTYGYFPSSNPFTDVEWSPSCGFIALPDDGLISLKIIKFDGTTETLSGPVIDYAGQYNKVVWSANGRYLLYVASNGQAFAVRDMRIGTIVPYAVPDEITDVAWFNKSLSFVATGTMEDYKFILENQSIHLLKKQANEQIETPKAVAVSPDDCFFAKAYLDGSDSIIKVYDSEDLTVVAQVTIPDVDVHAIDWNPIACCSIRYIAVSGTFSEGTAAASGYAAVILFDGVDGLYPIASTTFDVATSNNTNAYSIKWSPRGKDFLVTYVGDNVADEHYVSVYTFDPSDSPILAVASGYPYQTLIGSNEEGSAIYADWGPCGVYIVIAGALGTNTAADQNIEIIKTGETVNKCVVEGNRIANVCGGLCGLGIWGAGCCNLIDNNVVCCSGVPYTSGVYARHLGGLLGEAGYLENLYGNDYCVCCPCDCTLPAMCDYGCTECEPLVTTD